MTKFIIIICILIISISFLYGYTFGFRNLFEERYTYLYNRIYDLQLNLNSLREEFTAYKESRMQFIEYIYVTYKPNTLVATAYSPSVDETDDSPFITANGDSVCSYTAAVSRDLYKNGWKFGKYIYIKELDKFLKIKDVMNKRYQNRIDIFMWTKQEAMDFGVKKLTVFLL